MPEALEKKLKATARTRGYSGERFRAYVYGTMRKTGWRPSRERASGRSSFRAALRGLRRGSRAARTAASLARKKNRV